MNTGMSSFEIRRFLSDALANDGVASVRYPSGAIAVFKITPIVSVPALGDFKEWEARRRDIQFINQVLMGSMKGKA